MNSTFARTVALSAAVAFSPVLAWAEPTVGAPVQAHGGQGGARSRTLDDLELTAITRAEESYVPQLTALTKARAELVTASLGAPTTVTAKTQAVANAELALALSRADAFAKLKTQLKGITPAKTEAFKRALGDPAATGGGGGGRGGAAAAGAAAGARGGAAAGAPAAAAPARGN